jgi:hypothetical protein
VRPTRQKGHNRVGMLTLQTRLRVDGIIGSEIFEFLANPTDEAYRRWWPGTHLQLHLLERHAGHVGDVVYMDEYVGKRRLRMKGIVIEAKPGRRLVWQTKKAITLPARLELELRDYEGGVAITHTTRAGFRGPGRVLDPLFRIYFSERFARDLDEHVKTEFPLMRNLLAPLRDGLSTHRHERTEA